MTSAETVLFERPAHNPSWRSVREAVGTQRELVDFCVPVNPYSPPPALLHEIAEQLPQILKHYPDDAIVLQRAIGDSPASRPSTSSPPTARPNSSQACAATCRAHC